MLTFLEVGFGGNLVQGFRAYAWRAVPSFPQIALLGPSLAFWPQPFQSLAAQCCCAHGEFHFRCHSPSTTAQSVLWTRTTTTQIYTPDPHCLCYLNNINVATRSSICFQSNFDILLGFLSLIQFWNCFLVFIFYSTSKLFLTLVRSVHTGPSE